MTQTPTQGQDQISAWHRNLLIAAAVGCMLIIAMGGVLCVTQSIRSCPDWPGCFGRLFPPLETSPILEFTHRVLAAGSGLLILASAIAGLVRTRRLRWIFIPPLAAGVLLVEVSIFGALVVLHGIAPGWAAVDVGSALLVVALMVTAAVIATVRRQHPHLPDRLTFKSAYARLAFSVVVVVYVVLVSGVLVAGRNSLTGCLGWPIYAPAVWKMDLQGVGNILRLILSAAGVLLTIWLLVQTGRNRYRRPAILRLAGWLLISCLLEALLQALLLVFGSRVLLLVGYTVCMAAIWGVLVALAAHIGLQADLDVLEFNRAI